MQVRILLSCEATSPSAVQQKKSVGMFATTTATTTATGSHERSCALCSGSHGLWLCDQFKAKSVDERAQTVAANRLCFSCLRRGHQSRSCRTARACGIDGCSLRHNRLLHGSRRVRQLTSSTTSAAGSGESATDEVTIASVRQETRGRSSVLLQVVPVRVHGADGRCRDTLALLDPGAQTSLCTLLDSLHIAGEAQPLRLHSVEAEGRERLSRRVQLELSPLAETEDRSRKIIVPEAFYVDRVNVRTPVVKSREVSKLRHLEGLTLPDLRGEVELLLGANVLEAVLQREARIGKAGEPVAIRTAFGWSLTGSLTSLLPEHHREVMFVSASSRQQSDQELNDLLQGWWNTESFGTQHGGKSVLAPEDQKAMDILERTTKHQGDKYEVGLLWQDDDVSMPDNHSMACSRLRSLERSLNKDPEKAKAYAETLEGYVKQGYARKLTHEERQEKHQKRWFLPHHAVTHPDKPKPRVVFDAAAQVQGTSLNSQLLKGPDLMQKLQGVLLRFRQEQYALVADIYQMFHQIQVRPEDQPALSFLWRGMETGKTPDLYQMLVIFGAKCSPCIANYILRRALTEHSIVEGGEGVPPLFSSFYVDDFVHAEKTSEGALKTMERVTSLLSQGGFKLTKWRTSHPMLLQYVPDEDRDASQKTLTPCESVCMY